jgi:hypothetical protein
MVKMFMSQEHKLDLLPQPKHLFFDTPISPAAGIDHQAALSPLLRQQIRIRVKGRMDYVVYDDPWIHQVHSAG